MISTRSRRAGSAVCSPPLANLAIAGLIIGATSDVRYWPAGRAHREEVVAGAPRAFLFELPD